ncbi:MAG: WD40/YVTN/BNR-like repeat-containing protein [Syntrophothermus sp.]
MPTFTSASRTAMLLLTLFILNIQLSAQNIPSAPAEKTSAEQTSVKKKVLKPTEIFSQRKNRIKGRSRFDDPDMYVEFQKMIRTREGESSPRYSQNYLMEEYSKAAKTSSMSKTAGVLNWIERGPGNVSGRTRGLVIDKSDSTKKTWWAGSVGGGIWKTTDMGASWTNKSPDLPNLATTVIVQSFSNPDIFYCGTGEGFFNADAIKGSGIFKSTDHGNSWFQLPAAANFDFYCINRMLVDPSDPNIVVAGTRSGPSSSTNPGGIQRSTDGGQTWTRVYAASYQQGVQDLRPDPADFNTIYASSYLEGVFKSTDKGATWTKSSQGLTFTGTNPWVITGRIEIAVSPVDPKVVWASAVTRNGSGLFYSANGAQSWDTVGSYDGKSYNWLNTQGWYDNTMAAHPFDAKTVFFGGIDVWKATLASTPGTASFSPVTDGYRQYGKPYVHPDQHNIVMIPISETLKQFWILNANDGGVAYSTNGGTSWVSALSGGYNTTQFYGVDKMPGQSKYIGGTQDNGTWLAQKINPDKTTNYTSVIGGDGFEVSWHYKDPLKIIGGSQYNNFYKTTNGGTNWISAQNGLTDVGSGKGCFISKIGESNSDPDIIYTTGSKGIWRSENFGDTWALCDITTSNWTYNGTSTPVSVSIADANVVWAGHSFSNSTSRLYMSSDHGLTFKSVKPYSGVALGTLTGIDTHPLDPKTAYLTFSIANAPKILKTTDLGETWTDISGFGTASKSSTGFPNVATYCVVVMPYNTKIIWAGTEIGLFESTDDGASWHYANNGLPAVCIWDMKIVDDEVIVATHGRGIFSVTLPELNGYKPPAITLTPLIKKTYQSPAGALVVETSIRDSYDSLQVVINGNVFSSLIKPSVSEKTFSFTVVRNDTFRIQLSAYKAGMIYKSSLNTMLVYQLQQPNA